MCLSMSAHVMAAGQDTHFTDVGDRAVQRYRNNGHEFIKISHPETHSSTRAEKHFDGLIDYIGDGKLGAPYIDEGANGQGDRGQSYSWAAATYQDWMYVCTQFNPGMATVGLMGNAGGEGGSMDFSPETMEALLNTLYRGDFFISEEDRKDPGSVLSKINVKTGEVRILMSKTLNGMAPMFRGGLEFHGKLYFVGAVNGTPSIYEIDPKTDAFQCIYKDVTMERPGAWQEALYEKKISPTIRGMTVFEDHLVISCVGLDANPYIAVSSNPSAGAESFTIIASSLAPDGSKGELLDYPACHLHDSIYGGSIWEMITFNDRLYVAMCTGRPEESPDGGKSLQSFGIIRGECSGDVDDPDAWTWTPIVGDQEEDGAKYTFGIDPERTRSGACNMMVFNDHLYVGEYNDTEIALIRLLDSMDLEFMADNLEQSVSLYRMDADETFELVAGTPTKMFPQSLSGLMSGFGDGRVVHENQYIWQMTTFQDQLYAGTFDESSLLYPIAQLSNGDLLEMSGEEWLVQLRYLMELVKSLIQDQQKPNALSAQNDALTAFMTAYSEMDGFLKENPSLSALTVPSVFSDEINTAADLHRAMMLLPVMMEIDPEWSDEEMWAAKEAFCAFYEKLYEAFMEIELPGFIRDIYSKVLNSELLRKVVSMGRCLYYLKDVECGFDMMTTANGVDFEVISRSGMGDPYNHGIRAFATNEDASNPWMCIGTANTFYGTQIWRMEGEGLNLPSVNAAAVTFVSGEHCTVEETTVSAIDGQIAPEQVPAVTPADGFYQFAGWAIKNSDGELQLIDLDSCRFDTDVTLCAVCDDLWTPYRDMKQDRSDWFYQEVRDLSVSGMVAGYSNGTFRAENPVNWGEALKLISLAAGYPEQDRLPGTDHFASGYLALARKEGFVDADRAIDLHDPISRLDIAQVAAKALQIAPSESESLFADINDPYVNALSQLGVLKGRVSGVFGGEDNIKRSEMAVVIWRLNQLDK